MKLEEIIKENPGISDLIANILNKKMYEIGNPKIYIRDQIQGTIKRWLTYRIRTKNKLLITEAINQILGTTYTIYDLEKETGEQDKKQTSMNSQEVI